LASLMPPMLEPADATEVVLPWSCSSPGKRVPLRRTCWSR
jgi:hypothetical protein